MLGLYSVSTFVYVFILLLRFRMDRRIMTLPNLFFVMVVMNFSLYLCNWSDDFIIPCCDQLYVMIIVLEVLFGVYAFVAPPSDFDSIKFSYRPVKLGSYRVKLSTILLVICIVLSAIEAYYYTGSFFAGGSESHTSTMPVIGPIKKALIPVSFSLAALEIVDRKNSTVTAPLLCIAAVYMLVCLRSRFWFLISVLCALVVVLNYKKKLFNSLSVFKKISVGAVIALIIVVFLEYGDARLPYSYATCIAYCGPFADNNMVAWYYGYFPYSFYNLNLTLINIDSNSICYLGKFLALPFACVLQIEDVLGLDYNLLTLSTRVITNTAATVATGFFESYADFNEFFFVSIIFMLGLTRWLQKKKNFFGLVSFSSMFVVWFFMSFMNLFTNGVPLYVMLLSWVVGHYATIDKGECREFEKQ